MKKDTLRLSLFISAMILASAVLFSYVETPVICETDETVIRDNGIFIRTEDK